MVPLPRGAVNTHTDVEEDDSIEEVEATEETDDEDDDCANTLTLMVSATVAAENRLTNFFIKKRTERNKDVQRLQSPDRKRNCQ